MRGTSSLNLGGYIAVGETPAEVFAAEQAKLAARQPEPMSAIRVIALIVTGAWIYKKFIK